MVKHVKVGVVGTSWYADLMHLPALQSHPNAEITAICGRRLEPAQELAKKYAIPQVFTDYQNMINEANLDAVIVATPDDLHYPITMAALEAGLHVICEKPLTLSLAHAKAMYNKAESAGVKHMTYFSWRWQPAFQYCHRLIQEGYLGRCYYSELRYVGDYGRDGSYAWRWDREKSLGILGDLGSHMIDFGQWCLGDITTVNAKLDVFKERPGHDGKPLNPSPDSALLSLSYKNNGNGVIYVSSLAHLGDRGQQFQMVFYGEDGTLELDFDFKNNYVIRGAKSNEESIQALDIPSDILQGLDPKSPFMEQVNQSFTQQAIGTRLFIDAIVNDLSLTPSFYDGLRTQLVIQAALESNVLKANVEVGS